MLHLRRCIYPCVCVVALLPPGQASLDEAFDAQRMQRCVNARVKQSTTMILPLLLLP
jgi:hypothetical protein